MKQDVDEDTQTGSKMHVSIGKMLSASFAAHLEESPARARKYLKVGERASSILLNGKSWHSRSNTQVKK